MPKMNPDKTPALNEDGTPAIAMMPKPQTLCTTQAAEGMVVLSETPAVVKMREGVLEFFLANHPLDCPVCDKGGECMLQDQTMAYARGLSRVQDMYALRKDLEKDYPLSELITLDRERCIQCARCTRFQDEIAHDHVLELVARGSKTMIDTLSDPPFDSHYSGNTIDLCPVGALTSRDFRFKARVWEVKNSPTVSMIDGSGTNIFVSQRNESMMRVIPRDNESVNECWISDRDRFGLDYIDHDARLTQPLVRRDGNLQPATWDEALQTVADRLTSTHAGAIGAIGSGKLTNEGALAMSYLFRGALGTPNVDCELQPTIQTPGKPSASFYEELEAADVILVVGANPNEELPILDLRLKKAAFQRKAHLININTYKTSMNQVAKQAFMINEGSEVALLNGLAKLAHQSWSDEPAQSEALRNVSSGAGATAWIDSLAPYSSTRVAEISGVDEVDLRAAATAIAGSERLFLLIGEHASPATLAALQNLAALKGRTDALVVLHSAANAVGARRAGLTPGEGGMNGAQMLDAAFKGQIKTLYIAANNPLRGAQDFNAAKSALETAEFVVVQTLFLNDLTEHADVVLPAASFLEQDGTTTNFHGKSQNLRQAFRPRERRDEQGNTLSACAPDWVIFTKLLQLVGKDSGVTSVAQWTQKFRALPVQENAASSFAPVAYETSSEVVPEGAFRLLSGPLLMDGGESFKYCDRLKRVVPEPFVQINRRDARGLGIGHNDLVEVKSGRMSTHVRAKVGRAVKEGTVWMPQRLRDVQMNQMMQPGALTSVSITKLEDAPAEPQQTIMTSAGGVGHGQPSGDTQGSPIGVQGEPLTQL
jgi:NADH-quinone oxidoreductase subunit G